MFGWSLAASVNWSFLCKSVSRRTIDFVLETKKKIYSVPTDFIS